MTDFPDDRRIDDFTPGSGFEEVVGAATASEYLAEVVTLAKSVGAPSVTLASLQPSVAPAGDALRWEPGLSSYSWGINGEVVKDTGGHPFGIRIKVQTWFSNQIANQASAANPTEWQQFAAARASVRDEAILTFTPSGGEDVHLRTQAPAGNTAWEADSFLFDVPTQQLLFHVPGLGAPLGILIATFNPTGVFGFL
jgi:hypothetical protein